MRMEMHLAVENTDLLFTLENSIDNTVRKIQQAVHAIIEVWKSPGNDKGVMFKYQTITMANVNKLKIDIQAEAGAANLYENCDTLTTA